MQCQISFWPLGCTYGVPEYKPSVKEPLWSVITTEYNLPLWRCNFPPAAVREMLRCDTLVTVILQIQTVTDVSCRVSQLSTHGETCFENQSLVIFLRKELKPHQLSHKTECCHLNSLFLFYLLYFFPVSHTWSVYTKDDSGYCSVKKMSWVF